MRLHSLLLSTIFLVGCGDTPISGREVSSEQALTRTAELLEFEPLGTRQELFKEIARISLVQAGRPVKGPVLFSLIENGEIVAAPGVDVRADLLQAPDAGVPLDLVFESGASGWSQERRESLQGLSEREAAELVARSLLAHWNVSPSGSVRVDRASGAPYAAAYMDGILRLNPSLVYLASAAATSAAAPSGANGSN